MARPEDEVKRAEEAIRRSEDAIRKWRTTIEEQSDAAFRTMRAHAGQAHLSMSEVFKKMWVQFQDLSKRGSTKGLDELKKNIREFATFAPKHIEKAGEDIGKVLAAASDVVIMRPETIAQYSADVAQMKTLLGDFYESEMELSAAAESTVLANNQDSVRGKIRELQRLAAIETTTEESKLDKAKRVNAQVDGIRRVSSQKAKTLQAASERESTKAALRVRKDATNVIESDRGVFGAIARSKGKIGGLIQDLAKKEVSARGAAKGGGAGGAAAEFMSMRAFMSEGVGSISKMMGGMTAFSATIGGAAIVIQQLMAALNGVKMTAAAGLEVMSVQGAAAGSAYGQLGNMAHELQIRSQALSREVLGTGANMDQLNTASADVAKTLGGLGSTAGASAQFIVQLSRIQLLAPLAGMSGADAMKLIAHAQRGLDLNKMNKTRDWFMDIRRSALVAKTSVSSLAGAMGDLESAGAIWGSRAENMHAELASLTVGFKGSESARLMLMKGFGNLRNMDMGRMVGMTMFGRNMELGEAVGRLQQGKGKGGIASELVGSFRGMLQEMNFDMGTKEGQFEFAQVVKQFGGEAFGKAALFSPQFQKAMLDKSASGDDIKEAFLNAQSEFDDEKRGAMIQQNQENILQQLLEIVTSLSQFVIRAPIFGGGGSEAIKGRIEYKAAGLEEQGDLLRRMRGAR